MKKYFSINIFDEDKELLLHDTLDEAKKACLDNAREQYDYACEMEDIDEYERVVDEAIYGVVMGKCISTTRQPNKEDAYESQYDYIVESPELVEHNGWIKCTDKLPTLRPTGSSTWVLLWGLEEETDNEETMFQGFMFKGGIFYSESGKCHQVTHWQPLPSPPVIK